MGGKTGSVAGRVATGVVAVAVLLGVAGSQASGEGVMTPAIVDFGNQPQGTPSASRRIELANRGHSSFFVHRGTVNSGPDNADFVITKDQCTGTTLEPGGTCTVEIAFKPISVGPTSQTFGVDVSGAEFRTLAERTAVMTLNGSGTPAVGDVPGPSAPGAATSSELSAFPTALLLPVAGAMALGLGMLILASTNRHRGAGS